MSFNEKKIQIPKSYVTPQDTPIRISNYPESTSGVSPIQIVTLNQPKKMNAINTEMIQFLITFYLTVDLDNRVKVIIVTGAGKAFSAGIDLTIDTSSSKNIPTGSLRDPGGILALAMFKCSKLIIVAYNGLSVGIGMISTLAATIR